MRDELEYIVIVGQAARGRRHTEVTALGQHHILSPDTQLEILSKGKSKYGTILQNNVPDPVSSVADPGCLSRILIFVHPGSRIQIQQQKRRVKKIIVLPYSVATNMTKLLFYFRAGEEKNTVWTN